MEDGAREISMKKGLTTKQILDFKAALDAGERRQKIEDRINFGAGIVVGMFVEAIFAIAVYFIYGPKH